MCPIVDSIKENFDEIKEYDISKKEDIEKIEIITKKINDYYNQKGEIEIIKIAQNMGFKVYNSVFEDQLISGFISIDENNVKEYESDKIIKVNRDDNLGHRRFTVAHEIGHYIFDYNNKSETNFLNAAYKTDDSESLLEKRACYFAASLLMPKEEFEKKVEEYKNKNIYNYLLVETLAYYFGVSNKAVEIRFKELGIEYMKLINIIA